MLILKSCFQMVKIVHTTCNVLYQNLCLRTHAMMNQLCLSFSDNQYHVYLKYKLLNFARNISKYWWLKCIMLILKSCFQMVKNGYTWFKVCLSFCFVFFSPWCYVSFDLHIWLPVSYLQTLIIRSLMSHGWLEDCVCTHHM
jgi:hypothetical protein